MEPMLLRCGACGAAIRTRQPADRGDGSCSACGGGADAPVRVARTERATAPLARGPWQSRAARLLGLSAAFALLPLIDLALGWDAGRAGQPRQSVRSSPPLTDRAEVASPPAPSSGPAIVELESRAEVATSADSSAAPIILPVRAVASPSEADVPRAVPPPPPAPVAAVPSAPAESASLPAGFSAGSFDSAPPRRFRVSDEDGRPLVARLHGEHAGKTVLLLPDGQLGIPNLLVPTNEPFRPFTADQLEPRVKRTLSADFLVFRTRHYLIFYKSNHEFAESSGRLLENLYERLLEAFRKHDLPVHEAEFPLVAVIYPTEKEFRANHRVDPEIQAFYEIFTNRIYFYEESERDAQAPEVSALRKPQTVAHEGTHQILQNIGIHPRMSPWPIWLIEGLAEYCAAPACLRKGAKPAWDGLGMINPLHMATIRELDDPVSLAVLNRGPDARALVREPGKPLVELLISRSRLTPTEYALAWAMTHYLAFKRQDEFITYLRRMSQLPPLVPRTAADHLADFREVFGHDLAKVDRAIDAYLKKLAKQKGYTPMPFYAVMFEQSLPSGLFRRAAMVSQSPQMIQQWIQDISNPQGALPTWQALPHPTRARATLAIESWMRGM